MRTWAYDNLLEINNNLTLWLRLIDSGATYSVANSYIVIMSSIKYNHFQSFTVKTKVFTAHHFVPIHTLFCFWCVYWDNLVCSTHFHFYGVEFF